MLEFLQQLQLNDVINVNPGHLVFVDLQTLNSSFYFFSSYSSPPPIVYKISQIQNVLQP